MKRSRKTFSSHRRSTRVRLVKRLSDKLAGLMRAGKRHTPEFLRLDKQLEKVQKAVMHR